MDSMDMSVSEEREKGPSRREFLTRTGLMAGGIALLGISGFKPREAAAVIDTRSYTTTGSALELDGLTIFLKSSEGGFPRAEVITEPVGPTYVTKKHLGPPRFQDIAIQCDPVLPKPLFEWIAGALTMSNVRKNGAIVTTDFNMKEQSRLQFNNALITEIAFPPFDASSKDAGYLTVKFAPEFTSPVAGKGTNVSGDLKTAQKMWLPANFVLKIPGLDCSKVNKIEALTIKQKVGQDQVGQMRDYLKEPAKLEFPNLVITLAESSAGSFYAWFQDMVLKGNAGENNEKPGTLELMDSTLKQTLMTIYFHHLGIFGFTPEKASNVETIKRVKVEMYCEQITLTPLKA